MNKRMLTMLAGGVVALTAAAVVAALAVGPDGSGATEADVAIHQVSADYPSFDTVAAAAARSAVVVRATAVEVGKAYRVVPDGMPVEKLPARKAAQAGVMQHDVTFRVDAVYKGAAEPGATLPVVHLGGQIGVDRYVVENEPTSVAGRSYVLFLVPVGDDGRFGIVGGPQGRYLVDAGALRNLGEPAGRTGVSSALDGMSLAAFEAKPLG